MWHYEKKLQYPAKVGNADLKMAKYLITQYGGPDGELAAALRYLNQRYSMPTKQAKAILNDIGTEELAHLEIIATLVHQLTKGATAEEMRAVDLGGHYADHDNALFYVDATGNPWTAAYIQAKGDAVADLHEDMAAEEKARATYQWLIDLTDDPDLKDTLSFLRQREVVHFQRFGETLDIVQEYQNSKHVF
ncbi:spore coat protein JC [Hydrogenispora ethanolica]|jgi:spore coat protein JC|uniref:Spore coat protein JC n=1 Tax=Hydrogenispora ethanolica TaxID=1082276 RepID=A0A4R1RFP8_HYDET|nr:manganese catalase family protein [Hydrogenispora ethanolica]TCL64729.1 spore coat protein JC [Hydrogenispora ethanolica]